MKEGSMANKGKWFLLAARIVVGIIFVFAGWMKVSAMAMTVGYFAQMGIAALFAYIVGYAEVIGGVLIILGLWTCLSSAILAIIMLFAIWYSRTLGPAGIMTPLAVLAGLLGVMGAGPGALALSSEKKSSGEM